MLGVQQPKTMLVGTKAVYRVLSGVKSIKAEESEDPAREKVQGSQAKRRRKDWTHHSEPVLGGQTHVQGATQNVSFW